MPYKIRPATEADGPQLAAINREANGDWTGRWVEALLAEPAIGPAAFCVAADGEEVAATVTLLPATWTVGGLEVPAAQVEFVATRPAHRNQGLMRECLAEVHRWAADQGRLVTYLTGIPYYYLQFGYEYAIDQLALRLVDPGAELTMPAGWAVRVADVSDVDDVESLHRRMQELANADVRMTHGHDRWRKMLATGADYTVFVAEGPEGAMATTRVQLSTVEPPRLLAEVTATEAAGVHALLAHLRELEGATKPLVIVDRPGTVVGPALAGITHPYEAAQPWYLYVRVGDPVALLDHLRPVLSARLGRSPLAGVTTELILTLYRSSITLSIKDGDVVAVTAGPGIQDPRGPNTAGMPPEAFATILFGARPPSELASGRPDIVLGKQRGLVDALFPGSRSDLMCY